MNTAFIVVRMTKGYWEFWKLFSDEDRAVDWVDSARRTHMHGAFTIIKFTPE